MRLTTQQSGRRAGSRAAIPNAIEALDRRLLLAMTPVGADLRVDQNFPPNEPAYTSVAADDAGNFVVAWDGWDITQNPSAVIRARRFNAAGEPLGDEFLVSMPGQSGGGPAFSAGGVAVAMDADGDFVVVYRSATGISTSDIYLRRFDASGRPKGDAERVNPDEALLQSSPAVAMDDDGDFVVAWQRRTLSPEDTDIYFQRYSSAGTKLGDATRANVVTQSSQTEPTVAMDGDGDFVVGWITPGSVAGHRFDSAGNAATGEFTVNANSARAPAAAMCPDGSVLFTWDASTTGVGLVEARRIGADGAAVGAAFRVGEARDLGNIVPLPDPAVAVAPDGQALVVWQVRHIPPGSGAGQTESLARLIGVDGAPRGAAFAVDSTGSNREPSVAAAPGRMVVAWDRSPSFQNRPFTVHAQRYELFPDDQAATIGGVAWNDVDGNGLRDAGEPLQDGVRVELYTASGTPAAAAVTSGGGAYQFPVRAGEPYVMAVVPPAGWMVSPTGRGGDGRLDNDFDPVTRHTGVLAAPAAGGSDLTIDAGLAPPAGVSGFVFNDADGDGAVDAGEAAMPGWVVFVDDNGDGVRGDAERSATTDRDGRYVLGNLAPGAYRLRVEGQDLWAATAPAGGVHELTLTAGQVAAGRNFGERTLTPGTAASPAGAAVVVHNGTGTPNHPAVALAGNAGSVVVWRDLAGTSSSPQQILARLYDPSGAPRGPEFVVASEAAGMVNFPGVAADADGDFVVTWELRAPAGTDYDAYARRYAADGTPRGDAFRVHASPQGFQEAPAVAMADDGRFVVTWVGGDGDEHGIFARRFDAAGNPAGAEFRVTESAADDQKRAAVAADANGNFVVAWYALLPDGDGGVLARQFDSAGNPRGGDLRVDSPGQGYDATAVVDTDPAGNIAVAWIGTDRQLGTSYMAAYLRRYNARGVPQGQGVRLDSVYFPAWPAVTLDGHGDVVAGWSQGGGAAGSVGVFAQRVNAAGVPQGTPIRPDGGTQFSPGGYSPALAAGPDGGFVVVWLNNRSVLLRRYTVAEPAPRVAAVYVSRADWSDDFRRYLRAQGLGHADYGFALQTRSLQHAPLPWVGLDRVSVTFDRNASVEQADLAVRGAGVASYPFTDFRYDPATKTATWTLGRPFSNDRVVLDLDGDAGGVRSGARALDGEWRDAAGDFPSGDGTAGDDFRFRFAVLAGDVNRSGTVLADDFSDVKRRFFRSTANPGTADTAYSAFHDVDGSGSILANDFSAVKLYFFNALPPAWPEAGPVAIVRRREAVFPL
jgi:hypothetical protein